uniref:Uncharacterized protein n=1 Tax=Knipowitschia caucasica TaxID=637954 RepID=A0AAV2IXA4_KNICA
MHRRSSAQNSILMRSTDPPHEQPACISRTMIRRHAPAASHRLLCAPAHREAPPPGRRRTAAIRDLLRRIHHPPPSIRRCSAACNLQPAAPKCSQPDPAQPNSYPPPHRPNAPTKDPASPAAHPATHSARTACTATPANASCSASLLRASTAAWLRPAHATPVRPPGSAACPQCFRRLHTLATTPPAAQAHLLISCIQLPPAAGSRLHASLLSAHWTLRRQHRRRAPHDASDDSSARPKPPP